MEKSYFDKRTITCKENEKDTCGNALQSDVLLGSVSRGFEDVTLPNSRLQLPEMSRRTRVQMHSDGLKSQSRDDEDQK